ncbi:MAG: hypothetical protein R3F61_05435 [Myxococcota bacterium]
MDAQLLAQIQRELRSFEDRQLWALFELALIELRSRGLLEPGDSEEPVGAPADRAPLGPDAGNRGDESDDG